LILESIISQLYALRKSTWQWKKNENLDLVTDLFYQSDTK